MFALVVSFINFYPASANELNPPNTLAADTINASVKINYSLKTYCVDVNSCSKGKTLIPYQVWVERSGYAGYIPFNQYYVSATHYVVTYWGPIRKGPHVPTRIDVVEDINKEGLEFEKK